MSRRRQGRSRLFVGSVTLIVIVVATYLGFRKENPFDNEYHVTATFKTAASEIRPGAPVRIAGVEVGRVRKVELSRGGLADVDMEIFRKGRPVHADATAKIRPRLFLEGNFFVDLKPGTAAKPEIDDKGRIPLSQTAVAVQFDELLSVFDADTRRNFQALNRGFADSLDEGGAEALRRGYYSWKPAFRDSAINLQALRGLQPHDLSSFIRSTARISEALASNRAQLGDLISNYRQTLDVFAERQDDLRATLRGADDLLKIAPDALAELDGVLPPLRRLTAELRPALRIAPPILDRSGPFLAATAGLLSDDTLPALARDLGPAVRSLDRLNPQLRRLLPQVRLVSNCVRDKIVPGLKQTVPDGHLSTGDPAWIDGLRFGQGLASVQQNFDGNGFSTRYSAGADTSLFATSSSIPDLVEVFDQPLVGSRPKFTPTYQPPLRGDAPCEDQALASFDTEMVRARPARRIRITPPGFESPAELRRALDALVSRLEKEYKR